MRQLIARGGDVSYCDPWVPEFELDGVLHSSVDWSAERVAEADCVVLLTQHGEFLEQPLWDRAAADRGHAERRPGRRQRQAHLSLTLCSSSGRATSGRSWRSSLWTPGEHVVLADNWYATKREQLEGLEARGARVETADIRRPAHLEKLLAERPRKVFLLAAQASRPLAEREPDYTEETNVTGARHVAEAVATLGAPLVYGSSAHVYGEGLSGEIGPDHPYGVAARPLAPVQDLRGAVPADVRAARRLRAVTAPARDRVRAEPGRARTPGVADGGGQVQGAGGGRRGAAARRRRPRDDRRRPRRGRGADPARVAALAARDRERGRRDDDRGRRRRGSFAARQRCRSPRWTFSSPFEYRHRLADYL